MPKIAARCAAGFVICEQGYCDFERRVYSERLCFAQVMRLAVARLRALRHRNIGLISHRAPDPIDKVRREIWQESLAPEWSGMGVQMTFDSGEGGEKGARYVLKWETLGSNRDLPREPPFPPPSILRLYDSPYAVGLW